MSTKHHILYMRHTAACCTCHSFTMVLVTLSNLGIVTIELLQQKTPCKDRCN